jgi:excisionase family DNA binding protein
MSVSTSASAGPSVLSTSEAAIELGVSERTLRRYISAGLIGFRRLPGGHYRIPREAIAEFWSRHSPPPRRSARRTQLVARPPRPRALGSASTEAGARRPRLSASRQPRPYEVPPAGRDTALASDSVTGAHTN